VKPGRWWGPIASAFGQHYLYLHEFEAPRTLALEEVSQRIERDLIREAEALAISDWVEEAMARYEVSRS
jgi:parvulin-like peptidyl-prolyl isomerase